MKIVTYYYGDDFDPKILISWINNYNKSETPIPACLLYQNIDRSILAMWPYEKIEIKEKIIINSNNPEIPKIQNYLKSDIIKMLAFKYCGECIVMDIDTAIKKKITNDMIPRCQWGLVKQRKNKSYCYETYGYSNGFTCFKEFDVVDNCFCGLQIVRRNYYPQFIDFFNKNIDKLSGLYLPAVYGEAITCLTHKFCNGTFLQPEWNWMFDNRSINKDIIVEHYCSMLGKQLMMCQNFFTPSLSILKRKYV